jgi:hypothetical protein
VGEAPSTRARAWFGRIERYQYPAGTAVRKDSRTHFAEYFVMVNLSAGLFK